MTLRAVGTACVLVFSVAGLTGEADAGPAGPRCDKKGAEAAFTSGIQQYGLKRWEQAIPGLSKAANLCPVPNGPWVIMTATFGGYDYVPFFYLGRCNYELNDTEGSFNALRHFYLSSCLDEPKRHGGATEALNNLTEKCHRRLASQRRPQQHPPEFGEGLKAFGHDWGKAAENMWNALQIEADDGQMKPAGRFPDPYLPGLRLAKALVELGCVQEACAQYDRFRFKDLLAREDTKTRFKDERDMMARLSTECAGKNRERTANNETCQRWRCWVGQGRP